LLLLLLLLLFFVCFSFPVSIPSHSIAKKALAERRRQISETKKKENDELEDLTAQFARAKEDWQTQCQEWESQRSGLQKTIDEDAAKMMNGA
jgi:hypothetical protein